MTQRLSITYRKDGPARYVAHLDLLRTWERAIRRAKLPLAYSQGFSTHPRIAFAAPLSVGMIGEREQMDIFLSEGVTLDDARERLDAALPSGLAVVAIEEVGERLPALQASMRAAHYRVTFAAAAVDATMLRERAEALLALTTLDWEERRGGSDKVRQYDLRKAVFDLQVSSIDERTVIEMHLALEQERTGRPLSVLAALEVAAEPIELARTLLEIDRPQVAMRAWREGGRVEE